MADDAVSDDPDDPYMWLEEVAGERALRWVRARNAEALDELAGERFVDLKAEILEVLDADDRIPYPHRRGELLYNFWRAAGHPRGLWRRVMLESYRTPAPDWEVLVDVDDLAEREGESWVWGGAQVLRPDYRRALVALSRGGADASVVRELDIETRSFVAEPDGFALAEAKSDVAWIDRDHIFVGTNFGPGSLTNSGYPRVVRRWRRGTPLSEAEVVYEGEPDDVAVSAWHDPTEGFERDFVVRQPDFFTSVTYLLRPDGSLAKIDVPDDADTDVQREWLLIRPRTAWTVEGVEHPGGSLLAARLDAYLAGDRSLDVLFEPDDHSSLDWWAWTRHHLVVGTMVDVQVRLQILTPPAAVDESYDSAPSGEPMSGAPGWRRSELAGVPPFGVATIVDTDPDHSDECFVDTQSFVDPPTLRRDIVGEQVEQVELLYQAPHRFDAAGVEVRQHFATSQDGTQVPYFVVSPNDPSSDAPTLLTGYGGFEVSSTPSYSGIVGRGWLGRGGTYVVANIRGGGEYGPRWHRAALRENRHRSYEDFAAVARDLVSRRITIPDQLGIQGGSNGGLLMGVMLTTYPELFGAVACQVPLLDMRRYHRLLAGASWMAEWGDPDDPGDWAYLRTYSPYHLVEPGQTYPPVLFVTSTRDDRVHPGHARKMMAKMSDLGLDARLYENIEGGHGAAADNEQAAHKWALIFEFLWQQLTPN